MNTIEISRNDLTVHQQLLQKEEKEGELLIKRDTLVKYFNSVWWNKSTQADAIYTKLKWDKYTGTEKIMKERELEKLRSELLIYHSVCDTLRNWKSIEEYRKEKGL